MCRTPQGIRALARFYVVVFIPLFFGPYYAEVRVGARSFAFSLFLAIFVSLLPLHSGSLLPFVLAFHVIHCCLSTMSDCCPFIVSDCCLSPHQPAGLSMPLCLYSLCCQPCPPCMPASCLLLPGPFFAPCLPAVESGFGGLAQCEPSARGPF